MGVLPNNATYIEPAHLRDDHQTTSAYKGAEIGRVGMELLDLGPAALILVELLAFLARG